MASPQAQEMRIDTFQLIDHVCTVDRDDASISAHAVVPSRHSIYSGHFPGRPLMPGVLLTEMMAQTCGFLLLELAGFKRMPFLAALRDVRFRSFVLPGTAVTCHARRAHDGSGFAVMSARILRQGEDSPACDGKLTFRLLPFDNEGLRAHMLERAEEVGLSSPQPRGDGP